jgi:hypothetical protein
MKTDKALRKVLSKPKDELPYGFEHRLLRRLLADAERRDKRSYYRSLALVAFVSLFLVVGLLYILTTYFGIVLRNPLSVNSLRIPAWNDQVAPILDFSLFIAVLLLFLLLLDFIFRRTLGMRFRNGGKNGE